MPKPRKPLDEGCIGGIWCPVEGHVVRTNYLNGKWTIHHIPLTRGQIRTLHERRAEEARRERA